MKNGRLGPFILVSCMIHAGALFGAYHFLKLTPEELESTELIPVEIALVRKESSAIVPEFSPGERTWPENKLQAKSRAITDTSAGPSADTITNPMPKAVGRDPRVMIAGMATAASFAEAPAGEGTESKPMLLALKTSPLQVSPVYPAMAGDTSLLEVRIPAVPIEAETVNNPKPPRPLQKAETPLTNRLFREVPSGPQSPAPRENAHEPELTVSTLQLGSSPSGAQVYVDDLLSGVTPLDLELPTGKHEVRLALPNYYDWKAQIELTEKNKTFPVFFRLLPVESAN